ncbi:MAG: hypothetical protein M3445_02455 [Actinomycetota bacterium]|nr:hypothetical protein [Actinomycetota bacterium]
MSTDAASHEAMVARNQGLAWRYCVPIAVVSLLTLPLTAMWFLLLGFLVLVVTAVVAATKRGLVKQKRTLQTGGAVAGALLVGPTVYLLLWVLPL